MQSVFSSPRLSRFLAALASLAIVLGLTSSAFAAGRVVWKNTTLKERDGGSWKLEIEVHFPKAPDVGQIPMKFEFVKTAYYERSLVDGQDKPVERTIPLSNQLPTIESVDVGFYDPGTATIQARTRFDFVLKRKNGYEAGEYKVKIKDSRTDQVVGQPTTIKLTGENEIIDRREISFEPSNRKKKKEKEEKEKAEAEAAKSEPAPSEEAPTPESEPSSPPPPADAGSAPPSVEERPGGGCHMGHHGEQLPWIALGLAVGVFVLVRRHV